MARSRIYYREESLIQREIRLALSQAGCKIFRNSKGAIVNTNAQGGLIAPGSSDLIGIAPGGRFLAIEVKSASGRATREQLAFIEMVIAAGGIAGVCQTVGEALQLIGAENQLELC